MKGAGCFHHKIGVKTWEEDSIKEWKSRIH